MEARDKPLLIYDGDCGFCRRWVSRWRKITSRRVEYAPLQEVAEQFPEISKEAFLDSVQLVEPAGKISRGAEAVLRTLAHAPGWGGGLWLYRHLPGFAWVSERVYRSVADHRARSEASCTVPPSPSTYFWSQSIFLRGLGLVYLMAFASLWTQIEGLIGSEGILSISSYLQSVAERVGPERYRFLPTLFWFNSSDTFLHLICGGGVLLSLLLLFLVAPVPVLVLLWLFYLSLTVAGNVFLSFQWDALLLETGFLAIFLAPFRFSPRGVVQTAPSMLVLWLFRWLLFRLMFSAGVVKLSSGDPTWGGLTALLFHYETQPIPNSISWIVHQLPIWFHRFSCFVMFVIELVVPFMIFGPRTVRLMGCAILVAFQLLIIATGNYCFFNLLAILLCLMLLDDVAWRRIGAFLNRKALAQTAPQKGSGKGRWPQWILIPLSVGLLIASSFHLAGAFRKPLLWPKPFVQAMVALSPFRLANGYGLFAVMTTARPEIIVEGSRDGETWLAYEFKYKAGDLKRPPPFVAPHQPRLDWQMWFAALGRDYRPYPWFIQFCRRLLEGSPQVLALLEKNPFPEGPPRYVRARLYDYRFTDWKERGKSGQWWKRTYVREYCPVLSLKVGGEN